MLQITIQIEKPADDDGMILEPITKSDIVKQFKDEHNVTIYEKDVTFFSNKSSNVYGEDEPPLELGLWLAKVEGLSEFVRFWVIPNN